MRYNIQALYFCLFAAENTEISLQVCSKIRKMSLCVRKPTIWVPTRSDTNRPVQSQKMVRGWKFWIWKLEELYYQSSENKGADQLRSICTFVFTFADCWFSHAAAHFHFIFSFLNYDFYIKA